MPNYRAIVALVCHSIGQSTESFRVLRLLMPCPVHGFQFVMAFNAPPEPSAVIKPEAGGSAPVERGGM